MHFTLEPKQYQKDALAALGAFLARARSAADVGSGALTAAQLNNAFGEVLAQDAEIQSGAQKTKPYNDVFTGVPSACLRIPTGGGKTLLGAHAIATVANVFQGTATPFVIWLVHTDAILQQTLGALANPQHAYRQALDTYFDGRVKVCSMDSLAQVAAADFHSHAVVLVATIQSFSIVQSKQHLRKVYSFDEAYGSHFDSVPESLSKLLLTVTADDLSAGSPLRAEDIGTVKHCVVNLLRLLRPILIVDEAHNFYSPQSVQTIADFWPCAVVELTATPKEKCSNVIYSVSALALKSEHMIKLPIVLANHDTWQKAVNDALLTQRHLETQAAGEAPDYIRPIILFQAESADRTVTVDVLKAYLLAEQHIKPDWIAVHTGKEKGLAGVNLFDPLCPVRCVITVEALKEGWDCSLAYILCSLQNVNSATDAEQLLGRVLRMPYARRRANSELNKAYAHIVSDKFETTVDRLRERMVEKLGFNKSGLGSAFVAAQPDLSNLDQPAQPLPPVLRGLHTSTFTLPQVPMVGALPPAEQARLRIHTTPQGATVQVFGAITQPIRELLHAHLEAATPAQTVAFDERINLHNDIERASNSPAQRGVAFAKIPQLCLPLDGGKLHWEVVEPELLQTLGEWELPTAHARLDAYTPSDTTQAQQLDMSVKTERMVAGHFSYQQLGLNAVASSVTQADLIRWLDGQLQSNADLMQDQTLAYAGAVLRHLQAERKYTLTALERDKVRLINAMHQQIALLRESAEHSQFGLAFADMRNSASLESAFQYGFHYQAGVYPARNVFSGDWEFSKNFYNCIHNLSFKTKAGAFSEEFTCLRAIDEHAKVKHWVRNIELQPNYSFWLPTSKDKFYPDFVVELTDGRVLVVEYKGAHLDEPHKKDVGELWESTSGGRCLFLWAVKQDAQGRDVRAQLAAKLGA
jgi:type III restriction enzyme